MLKAVELGDDQHAAGEASGIKRPGEQGPVSVLAGIVLSERLGHFVGAAGQEHPHCFGRRCTTNANQKLLRAVVDSPSTATRSSLLAFTDEISRCECCNPAVPIREKRGADLIRRLRQSRAHSC
jgi:hypothetical protein